MVIGGGGLDEGIPSEGLRSRRTCVDTTFGTARAAQQDACLGDIRVRKEEDQEIILGR
jgi:hypothetical protein